MTMSSRLDCAGAQVVDGAIARDYNDGQTATTHAESGVLGWAVLSVMQVLEGSSGASWKTARRKKAPCTGIDLH